MPYFSAHNWTKYWVKTWSKQITLSTERTLEQENDIIEKRLSPDEKGLASKIAIEKLKKELDDIVSIEEMPLQVQEEFVRAKLNIPPHFWADYSNELKGRTIAIEIIKSQLERIHKFYHHMESERNKGVSHNGLKSRKS